MKRLILTVTNDLTYDQRMQRIAATLASAGYSVTLVGRHRFHSLASDTSADDNRPFRSKRLRCFFKKGFAFYAEYNLRLFCYLLTQKFDGLCAVDLDTMLPCLWAGRLKGALLFYDAHELFTEMKEVRTRPRVQRIWMRIERYGVPRFHHCYTVGQSVAEVLETRYGKPFAIVRNMPAGGPLPATPAPEKFLLYQGAVNEGRAFEQLVPALKAISLPLVICGDGNFYGPLQELIRRHNVSDRVELRGMLSPAELRRVTAMAWLGINFTEPEGLNQLLCLPNKFFDYVQAGLPQLTNDYPEYQRHNAQYEVALLLPDLEAPTIAGAVQRLLQEEGLYHRLQQNARRAAAEWTWAREAPRLLELYEKAFADVR